jgi:hypothetical protein
MAVNLHATHYRFGINELAETTHGWHAAEDANPAQGVISVDTTFLLRFTVQETGGTIASNTDQQFQCALNGGAFQDITTTSTIVKAVTTTVFANGADLTKRLSGTGTFESSGDGGTHDGLSGGPQNDIAASGNSETECALQIVSADVANSDVVTFRLTSPDFTVTNDVTPTLTVSEAAPIVVLPSTLAMTLTGATPVVAITENVTVSPTALAMTLTGAVPAVATPIVVAPSVLAMTLVGAIPDVTVGAGMQVTPGPLALAWTGAVPAIETPIAVNPAALALALSFATPAVATPVAVAPTAASLALTFATPDVTVSGGGAVTVLPSALALALAFGTPIVSVSEDDDRPIGPARAIAHAPTPRATMHASPPSPPRGPVYTPWIVPRSRRP